MEFEVVQRMKRGMGQRAPITTVQELDYDYMEGAKEFKELPKAYEAMKKFPLSITKVEVHASLTLRRKVTEVDATFYVVAPADQAETLQARFQVWANQGFTAIDATYIPAILLGHFMGGELTPKERFEQPFPWAWWALRENIFFSDSESIAKSWLESSVFPNYWAR